MTPDRDEEDRFDGLPYDELLDEHGRQVEFVGRGFTDALVASLRSQAGVQRAELKADRLVVTLTDRVEVAPLVSLLVRGGAELEEVRKDSASLEEVFLTLAEGK